MELGDNKQICRLCLEIVESGDAAAIGGKNKEILEVLLINVDLHIFDNAVACSRCMEEALSGFEFKSACFHVDNCIVDADVPVDIKKIFQAEMRGTVMANVNLENRQICRLCMSLIEDQALDCNTDLKDIIANCLPEVDINTVHQPLVCELCFIRMKKLNEFVNTCQEVERRINNYYLQAGVDHAIPVSVNLKDLLKFKDNTISGLVKEESSNFDSNLLKDPKKEDIANIECEEIHIKEELDSIDEMEDSVPTVALNNSGKSGFLKRKGQIGHFTSKGMKHFSSDGNTNKEFGCEECTYKTDRKDRLAQHMVRHKDKSEVEMHKCEVCEFETRYKSSMFKHMVRHRDPGAERKFKCVKCTYETDFMSRLRMHNLIHKDKSEVEMHKCENCEYESRYKGDMKKHMMTHRESKAERKYKCDKCPYETDEKSHLRTHNLIHKDKSEVEMHKCENCEYETRHKNNMIHHMQKHRNPIEEKQFKCDKCPYETNYKYLLCRHTLIHKNKSEVQMHKCKNCEFETMYKASMVRHMHRTHRNPEVEAKRSGSKVIPTKIKCDKCPYEAAAMFTLRTHSLTHKDKSEVEMHKCENCEFETKWKSNLLQHIAKHREPRAERKFKCDKCPYGTDRKSDLSRHNVVHKKTEVCENVDTSPGIRVI